MAYRSARKARVPGSRGKKRTNGILSAIGFLAIAGVVGFVAGKMTLSFGDKVVMLIREAHRHRQEIAALRQETEWLREQNAVLRQEARRLNTRSGIILEARKQGFGFPGERLLVIEPPPSQQP
ncbi:MAG: FtsB family cell division protein [Armatimonadota bacterium]